MHQVDKWTLGHKVRYRHPSIGELTATIHDDRPNAHCIWVGKTRPAGQQQDAGLILDGYASGPLRSQLICVKRILHSLGDLSYFLRRAMVRHPHRFPSVDPESWNGELILISTKDADTATFGLTYEWGRAPQIRALTVQWAGGELFDPKLY